MPTMRRSDVEAAAASILRVLPALEAKFLPTLRATPYSALVEALRPELPPTKAHHLVRAGCDLLAGRGQLELFLKSRARKATGVRIDQVVLVRTPGRRKPWAVPPDRPRARPDPTRRGTRPTTALEHGVTAEATAKVEATILRLLAEPISEADLVACSGGASPPSGAGWRPHYYLVSRANFQLSLPGWARWKLVGLAVRRLAERGLVELVGGSRGSTGSYRPRPQPTTGPRRCWRIRWARLRPAPEAPPAPSVCSPCPACLNKRRGLCLTCGNEGGPSLT